MGSQPLQRMVFWLLDVVVEATGIPEVGARLAYETITHHKHLIMVNVEADVTVGPFLRRLADNAGVVYSLVDGDQPGMTMNIVDRMGQDT